MGGAISLTLQVQPAGQTSLAGQVLDETGAPVQGAIITLGTLNTTTDAAGNFLLANPPVGASQLLLIDGGPASSPGKSLHPTTAWAAQQVVEAFPFDEAPRFLLHDRDAIFGEGFRRRVRGLGITEVRIAPRAPWQNPYVERLIGSIRRECLDHAIVLGEAHLRRLLTAYMYYYHEARPHLGLARDAPVPRAAERRCRADVLAIPQVGGLHHRYARAA